MKTKEAIIGFIKKYKIESIAVFIFSVLAAIAFDFENPKPRIWYDILAIVIFTAIGTFLVDKVFSVYENEIRQKLGEREKSFNVIKYSSYVVVVIVEYLLCRWGAHLMLGIYNTDSATFYIQNDKHQSIYALVIASTIVTEMLLLIIIYFVIKEKELTLKEYSLGFFMNSIFVSISCLVVVIGIFVLYMICEVLLGTIPYQIISRIIVFILTEIYSMGVFVAIENVSEKQGLFSKILVRYIMQIMVFIGFIIFYIYLIKIIVKFELPSNQVFAVCATLFSMGLMTSLMSLGFNEESKYNTAIKFLPVIFIPALILQIISLALRIAQHGITTTRYVGIMILIFEIAYLVLYILDEILKKEKVKLEKVLLIACLLIFIACFVPMINMYGMKG